MNKTLKHFTQTALQGLFGLLPIVLITILVIWIYNKINIFVAWVLGLVGIVPSEHKFLWVIAVLTLLFLLLYIIGYLMNTKLVKYFESLLKKIPGYTTIKEIIGIFTSSKEGKNRVLVVVIKGFGSEGYNIGLMYSQKESIIKDHYTVTLSMSPIPNGGYMFEVHKDNIYVIEDANFEDNLQYLLSMGVKSFAEILKSNSRNIDELLVLSDWLDKEENNIKK